MHRHRVSPRDTKNAKPHLTVALKAREDYIGKGAESSNSEYTESRSL